MLFNNSSVPIQDVAWKTCRERWTIEKDGERESGKPILVALHDDDDDDERIHLIERLLSVCLCLSLSLYINISIIVSDLKLRNFFRNIETIFGENDLYFKFCLFTESSKEFVQKKIAPPKLEAIHLFANF